MRIDVACIVEGHGEVEAVPIVLRRIAHEVKPGLHIETVPFRHSAGRLLQPKGLENAVEFAARRVGSRGGILVLLDCDDDCPAQLGPSLLGRVRQSRSDLAVGLALAKREFEAWFLASAVSLRGQRGLAVDLEPPPDPEGIRGAKAWLSRQMPSGRTYSETVDQPKLAARFDLQAARQGAPSFDKFFREVVSLLEELTS